MNELIFVVAVLMSNGDMVDVPEGHKAVFVADDVEACVAVEFVPLKHPEPEEDCSGELVVGPTICGE